MRPTMARAVGASALLSLSILCGCVLDDTDDLAVSSDESLLENGVAADPFAKKSITLSTGITMQYVEAGSLAGEPVILLHGLGDSSRSFFPTIQALLESNPNLHIFAPDLRGHGASSMPSAISCSTAPEACFEMSDLAADVVSFMNKKNIIRAHVVGQCMGSMVAQELGIGYGSRVHTVTLIGSTATGIGNPVIDSFRTRTIEQQWRGMLEQRRPGLRWPHDAYLLTPRDADPNADSWMATNLIVDPVADPSFLAAMIPEAATTRLGAWIGVIRNMATFDTRERLQLLRVPVLMLWATQDDVFPDAPDQIGLRAALDASADACASHYYHKTYGAAPLPASGVQESDLGHHTHWGAPRMVAADIGSWIQQGRPTADLPYADPNNVRNVLVAPGAAPIITRPGGACSATAE